MASKRDFFRDYGRQVFGHWDAVLGYVATGGSLILLTASTVGRARLNDVWAAGVTVTALGLTFALTSLSLLSAIVDRHLVQALDGLERKHGNRAFGLQGLLVAFRSVAWLGALGVTLWFVVEAVSAEEFRSNGWQVVQIVAGSFAVGVTFWLLGALVGLVSIVAVLISGKAELIRQTEQPSSGRPPSERSA